SSPLLSHQGSLFQRDWTSTTASPGCLSCPCVVNQDVTHRLCGDAKEMGAILKVFLFLFDHAQVRFMDERGRLQRMAGILLVHVTLSHLSQFVIDERHQFVERLTITMIPLLQ